MNERPELPQALASRAFLHEDPRSYLAGVEDALATIVPEQATEPTQLERRPGAS